MDERDVGLLGCGRWGSLILRDLLALGCRVHVVARSEESRRRASAATSIVESVEHLPPVAGVVVATPTSTHASVIDRALDLGVPVFSEKPLTPDVARARALAERAPDRLFVMDKWRYHPGVEELGRLARRGDLGEVQHIATRRVGWGSSHDDVDPVWVLTPHDLAIALEIVGALPIPASAVLERSGDAVVGMTATLSGSPSMSLTVSAASPTHHREVRVIGSEGVAVLGDSYAQEVLVGRPGREVARMPIPATMPLFAELAAFVGHLNGGPAPRSSAAEAVAVVETIEVLRGMA